MKSWQILKQAIPDGRVDEVARKLHVSDDTVRRWRREPESDDSPLSTGRVNPLDRAEELMDAIFLVNPPGAHFVADYIQTRYDQRAQTIIYREPVKQTAAKALREVTEAISAINLDEPADEIERKMLSAIEKMNEVKRRVRVASCGRFPEMQVS